MKKISFASLLVLASCHPALAGSANINDHFINKVTNIPNTTQQCEVVEVPVYGGNGDKTADALTGAIIGGVIGYYAPVKLGEHNGFQYVVSIDDKTRPVTLIQGAINNDDEGFEIGQRVTIVYSDKIRMLPGKV